ncbi:complex I 51 kDa subunit family protein [Oceanirhabdus sp. W0125-5]|uniref:complex I 51 kDa subunit family protein n=1 Tax=Oceanirhabdus sp. W0125-5 TaxID=2999116 RepID=UPI0022F30329|nr:NADH-ubiquinone oxidoreductase-F iron-sulfur binding region domain-containing protein [Oceanirhabdus sp. W0125-5]WBW99223.1 NADH-ubiquinone oxidoreductase-F iron-sulfur binding region domain-containing protein [Oceanirhabdus sp. W0125-5]
MIDKVDFFKINFGKYEINDIEGYKKLGGFEALQKSLLNGTEWIINELKTSGLRGRGGAAYPTGKKWDQASKVISSEKIIICNADEGEPATFKDRYLIQYEPYSIIEGMIIAALAISSNKGYIYIREEYKHLHKQTQSVIDICHANGYLGNNILNSGLDFDIELFSGAGAYVCGENSSLIESMEGRSGQPRLKPPYIKQSGLFNLPTLVNNVETFSAATSILRRGAAEFTKYGTSHSKGTKLISLCGNINKPGVYEVPFGITLREIIYSLGGGISDNKNLKFVQLGGSSGALLPAALIDVKYCYSELATYGADVGSGAILVVDDSNSLLDFLISTGEFFWHECCGKCVPCREGTRQLLKLLNNFKDGKGTSIDLETMETFSHVMKNASFCGLGKTAPTSLISSFRYFREEMENWVK